jgi:hypothetical protein
MDVEPEPALISFKISNKTYYAVAGMTWREWLNSSYNTGGFKQYNGYVATSANKYVWSYGGTGTINANVYATITENKYYYVNA